MITLCVEAGIWTFGDLYENGNLIPFETWKKRGIKSSRYMAWQGIVSAIPPKIKKSLKENMIEFGKTELDITENKSLRKAKCADFYNVFIHEKYLKPTAQQRYNENLTDDEWKKIYSLPRSLFQDVKSRDFQYRCIHQIIPTNDFLFRIGKIDTDKCTFCNDETDSFEHMFFTCEKVQEFWTKVIDAFLKILSINNLNINDVLLGINPLRPPILANQILVYAKKQIRSAKYNKKMPSLLKLKETIKELHGYEKGTALKNNDLMLKFNDKWELVKNVLDLD